MGAMKAIIDDFGEMHSGLCAWCLLLASSFDGRHAKNFPALRGKREYDAKNLSVEIGFRSFTGAEQFPVRRNMLRKGRISYAGGDCHVKRRCSLTGNVML